MEKTTEATVKGRYVAFFTCVECGKELSSDAVMYSDGVCPRCGHSSQSTVCDVITNKRFIEDRPRNVPLPVAAVLVCVALLLWLLS